MPGDDYSEGYQHGYEDATGDAAASPGPGAYVRVWMTADGTIEAEWKGCEGQLRALADAVEDVSYQILEELDE